jgi:hypothetical protein
MQLSQEDNLRLNVLLNQPLHALRIDEGKMIVHGLTEKGEAKIQLNPNCKDEIYIRRVKEVISSHVLGSPGGYPVYLKRWTRMGQARTDSLESLLKLGEPEAVVAVVGAAGLDDELARRAWWAMPSSENARRMLQREDIVAGNMGKVLADFLIEFLPFEEEPHHVVESVRLVLQPGLIDPQTREDLWKKGRRKNAYLVGFLQTCPHDLPEEATAHPRYAELQPLLRPLIQADNPFARQLDILLSDTGQAYLQTIDTVLKKPANQEVVVALFETIAEYFATVRPHDEPRREMETILADAAQLAASCPDDGRREQLQALVEAAGEDKGLVESMLVLAQLGEKLIAPIFSRTDAVGTVMRRKIEPVTSPMLEHLHRLLGR